MIQYTVSDLQDKIQDFINTEYHNRPEVASTILTRFLKGNYQFYSENHFKKVYLSFVRLAKLEIIRTESKHSKRKVDEVTENSDGEQVSIFDTIGITDVYNLEPSLASCLLDAFLASTRKSVVESLKKYLDEDPNSLSTPVPSKLLKAIKRNQAQIKEYLKNEIN